MPLSKQHKARTRERIIRSAGRVFRRVGFEVGGVDSVMAEAGLTRGGFYAHFPSKADLFAAVVGEDHGLIRLLAARQARSAGQWRVRTLRVLADYLHPAHLDEVAQGCSFAALTADASRASPAARAAYGQAFNDLVAQLLRRHGESADQAAARADTKQRGAAVEVAALAIGTLIIAAALGSGPAARAALTGAWASVQQRMGR